MLRSIWWPQLSPSDHIHHCSTTLFFPLFTLFISPCTTCCPPLLSNTYLTTAIRAPLYVPHFTALPSFRASFIYRASSCTPPHPWQPMQQKVTLGEYIKVALSCRRAEQQAVGEWKGNTSEEWKGWSVRQRCAQTPMWKEKNANSAIIIAKLFDFYCWQL